MPEINASAPKGYRYSHIYGQPLEPALDRPRARARVAALFERCLLDDLKLHDGGYQLAKFMKQEMGLQVSYSGSSVGYIFKWNDFIRNLDIEDFLDFPTVVYKFMGNNGSYSRCLKDINRVFSEEKLNYAVDELGGVHLVIDREFQLTVEATVRRLESPKFHAVQEFVRSSRDGICSRPQALKGAVRNSFFAAETLFKLQFSKATALGSSEIKQYLSPCLDLRYVSGSIDHRITEKQLRSFQSWVEGAHFIRHAQAEEVPTEIPEELAVALVSNGMGFIRWLADVGPEMK